MARAGTNHPSFTRRALLTGLGGAALYPGMAAARSASGGFAATKQRVRSCATSGASGFDVERLLEDCRRARTSGNPQAAVHDVLAREVANPGAVLLGLGEPVRGGIRTLYRSADLTVLNIIWSPLMQLMPHEHRMWSVIGIYAGREDNIFWRRQGNSVVAAQAAAVSAGEVVSLADDVIHSVANPIEKFTGAIHVYGGDFFATDPSPLASTPLSGDEVRLLTYIRPRYDLDQPRSGHDGLFARRLLIASSGFAPVDIPRLFRRRFDLFAITRDARNRGG